ncbi:methylated-DNA--[protein]-cysteine S-methyltransferase [Streptomyces sp. NPDC004610]|uniref:methylated-DNA--[protein]-cysteine S-methyltransferase n=1 Tax=unclassified Streptomyces TaxID=2593676 RepID=UPI0033A2045E
MTVHMTMQSPLGDLLLTGEEPATPGGAVTLSSMSMPGQRNAPVVQRSWRHDPAAFAEPVRQIESYFAGTLTEFRLELADSGTEFQRLVWQSLDALPYGEVTSYGALARRLGLPRDRVQALGAAIGANPLLIVRPCHRVIGADGTLRGYAGGVERKQQLLVHEGALQPMLG